MLGRKRRFGSTRNHYDVWLQRVISTPIQGGAADIIMASMIKIARNQRLKELGWKLLMQVHDELIL
jgi:DNA polymerase I